MRGKLVGLVGIIAAALVAGLGALVHEDGRATDRPGGPVVVVADDRPVSNTIGPF
ncbi:hypothetical protein ACFRKE_30295 [Kitasatospora indigofera]|uniref:Uncharacterized protein n=1 Tax=Kitasatospora indigofera TaxID=67307 RepID=A0A919KKQ2_9ACTN|nr:hypothetical protein [Kitasatospora indigofera]GHH60447.1 hypothetical protein GCM10018781_05150 [Kitasatospora indigofera]